MSLQETSVGTHETSYSSECAGVRGNDKRIVIPPKAKPLSTDAILLAGLRSGNHHAFEEMVPRFGGRLLATARRYRSLVRGAHSNVCPIWCKSWNATYRTRCLEVSQQTDLLLAYPLAGNVG
jgi:hypothetical protein